MTLTGYTIALAGPQQPAFAEHLEGLGATLTEPVRAALISQVIRRQVHAVVFGDWHHLAALISTSERAGLGPSMLSAFASDVIAAGPAEVLAPLSQRGLPAVPGLPTVSGRHSLEGPLAAALLARRRAFVAGDTQFLLQGNALHFGSSTIMLDAPLASMLRALADHAGSTLSRATLAQLCVLPRRNRGTGIELTVSRLRAALGESSWLITTVSRRGYRLAVSPPPGHQ